MVSVFWIVIITELDCNISILKQSHSVKTLSSIFVSKTQMNFLCSRTGLFPVCNMNLIVDVAQQELTDVTSRNSWLFFVFQKN